MQIWSCITHTHTFTYLAPFSGLVLLIGLKEKNCQDFPGGPVVKNLPCNAGDAGLILQWGTKIPPATEQLSQSTATTEREWLLWSPRVPPLQGKISPTAIKIQRSQINKYFKPTITKKGWLFSCSLCIPCQTSICFTYTLPTSQTC